MDKMVAVRKTVVRSSFGEFGFRLFKSGTDKLNKVFLFF